MMKRAVVVMVLLVLLSVTSWATSTIRVGDLRVSLYSDGWVSFQPETRPPKTFMDLMFSSIFKIGIDTGKEYYLKIENTSSNPVGVYAFVDGLNSIEREPEGGSWWYLAPYQSLDLKGWQMDNRFRSNFEFVDLGAPSGQGGKYPGWIFIAQYRVRVPRPVRRYGYDRADEVHVTTQDVTTRMEIAESKVAPATDAETGAGRVEPHTVTEVDYKLESSPAGLVAIRYGKKKPAVKPKPNCDLWLGIDALSNIDGGVYVSHVYTNSPAAMCGLEWGDVILYFDGKRMRYRDELHEAVVNCSGGQRVTMEVISVRDKRHYDVTAFIGCR